MSTDDSRADSSTPAFGDPSPDSGMKVPDGIDALVHAVPSSIPPEMFDELRPTPVAPPPPPRLVIPRPTSSSRMLAAKPVLPPSVRKIRLPEPPAAPEMAVVTAVMPVMPVISEPPMRPTMPEPTVTTPPSSLAALVTSVSVDSLAGGLPLSPPPPEVVDECTVVIPGGVGDKRARAKLAALSGAAAVLCAALFALLCFARTSAGESVGKGRAVTPTEPTAKAAPAAAPSPEPAPSASPSPSPSPPEAEPARQVEAAAAPPDKGLLKTGAAIPGRRIFVDGRTVGQTPGSVLVACGVHYVRVGSAGKISKEDIPCGGALDVGAR